MFRKSALIIVLTFLVLLVACKDKNKNEVTSSSTTASGDQVLPGDVPVYPKAELVSKRVAGPEKVYDFKANASVLEVCNFYDKELKKREWEIYPYDESPEFSIYFLKSNRSVRIVP